MEEYEQHCQPGRHEHTSGKLSWAAYADLGIHHARRSPYEHAQSPARGSAGRGRMKYAHDNSHQEGPSRPVRTARRKRSRRYHRTNRGIDQQTRVSRANLIAGDVRLHWDVIDDPNAAIQRMYPAGLRRFPDPITVAKPSRTPELKGQLL